MIFHVLAGLWELLRRVEATLPPRSRRFLLESLDSALALAERTATTMALSSTPSPLGALPRNDREEQGRGRDADGVMESNRLQWVIARLLFLLPQVLVIFTTMMTVVFGLLISAPVYPALALWRSILRFSSTGRIMVPTPLTIALWLRNRRLMLRSQAMQDTLQTPAEAQVLELADVGVVPSECNNEDTPTVVSELVQSKSQDPSGSQDVLRATSSAHAPVPDSSLPAANSGFASENADSHSSIRLSGTPLAHSPPTLAVLNPYQESSDSSSVYVVSTPSASLSPSPISSDSETHSTPAALSVAVGSLPPPAPSQLPPSGTPEPRLSPQMPSRIPVPIGRGPSPVTAERGAKIVKPVFSGHSQRSRGPSPSPKLETDSSGSGFTAYGRGSSPLHRAGDSSNQEFLEQSSESSESPDRNADSAGFVSTFPGRGNTPSGKNNPSPGRVSKSSVKASPSKRRSSKSHGRMRTSPAKFSRSPGSVSLPPRTPSPAVADTNEPLSQTEPFLGRETTSPTPGTSDSVIGSASSIPQVNSHVRALSFSRPGSIIEAPLLLLEGPSSPEKSRSTSPEDLEIASASESLHSLPPQERSNLSPDFAKASPRKRRHTTAESTSPDRETRSPTSDEVPSLESPSPPRLPLSPNPGPRDSQGSTSPGPQPLSPSRARLASPDSPALEPLSPNLTPRASRGSTSPASTSPGCQPPSPRSARLATPDSSAHEPRSPKLTPRASRGSTSPGHLSPSPGSKSQSLNTLPGKLTPPCPPKSLVSGEKSPSRKIKISPRELLSPSRQPNVPPRGQISPTSPHHLPSQSTSRVPASPGDDDPSPALGRSPPRKKLFSERDLPSQSSPGTHSCSLDSLSPPTKDPPAPSVTLSSPSRGTSDSNSSQTSTTRPQQPPSTATQARRRLSIEHFSPTLPGESPAPPVGASVERQRPRFSSPVRVTQSCFRPVPRKVFSTPTFCYSDVTYPQSSTNTTNTITTTKSTTDSDPSQRFAPTRSSSSTFSLPECTGHSSTSNQNQPSSSSSDPNLTTDSNVTPQTQSDTRSSGMSRWPGMSRLADESEATAGHPVSSGYETADISEDTSTADPMSDVDTPEAAIKHAGRTPGVRRQVPFSSLSQPESSPTAGNNESLSQPAEVSQEGDVPQTAAMTPAGSGRRDVSYDPSTLAAYAAMGQGPSPNHPSGYAPLAFLTEPLIGLEDFVDDEDEPLPVGPPRSFQGGEQVVQKFGGDTEPSGATGESRPAPGEDGAAVTAEPGSISAKASQKDDLAKEAIPATVESSSDGGPSREAAGPACSERRPSVVGSVVSLAELASAALSISSNTTPSQSVAGQSAEGEKTDSTTPSDVPSLISPDTPYLSMEVDLPLLADALGPEIDTSRFEQKYLEAQKSDGGSKSSSRPLSSHSSLEQSEKLDISDDESSPSETPQQVEEVEEVEDLEKTVMERSSPGSGDPPSDSASWSLMASTGTTSDFSIDESDSANVDDKIPKENLPKE